MDDSPYLGVIVFAVFVIVNGILYAFHSAISNMNAKELDKKAEEGNRKAKNIKGYLEKPASYMIPKEVVFMLMAMVIGCSHLPPYASYVMNHWFMGKLTIYVTDWFAWILAYMLVAIYLLFLMIAIGVMTPRRIGKKFSEPVAFFLADIAGFIILLATPLTWLIQFMTNLILGIFGLDKAEDDVKVTEEEIKSMLNEGHEKGVIMESEAQMITNIFELDEQEAKDVMTHRTNIVSIDGNWTVEEAVGFILTTGNSRFPVVLEDLDNIIGILNFRDAMVYYEKEMDVKKKIKDVPSLMRKPYFIPETKNLHLLFQTMQSDKYIMAIVVDEYGQTSGIVTMEDILEEIVGNILDEYDQEEQNIVCCEDGSYMIQGLTDLEEIEETLGISYGQEEFDTLNGYLIAKLGHIPTQEEKPSIELDGVHYQVLTVENKMIASVKATFISKDGEEELEKNIEEEEN